MQQVVVGKYAEVAQVLDGLKTSRRRGCLDQVSSVFAAFRSKAEAEAAQAKLPGEWSSAVAAGLDQHPLFTFAS